MMMMMMKLSVERKEVRLPQGFCDTERVRRLVLQKGPPLVVCAEQKKFSVRRRVFFSVDGLTVECENEAELRLVCKLVALDHNRWQTSDDLQRVLDETERMEAEAKERMEAPLEDSDFLPEEFVTEEEDVSIDEWGQLGYKWFKKEEVVYL
jgi:hypothetical protein